MSRTLLLAAALVACGKAPEAPPTPPAALATGLDYQDPASSGWRLVRDPASTKARLLLNLVGPAGLKTRGVGFNLKAPPALHFIYFDETGFPIRDLGVYDLKNSAPRAGPDPLEPVLLAGAVQKENKLTVGIFQKDRRVTAKDSGAPVLQIALELAAAAQAHVGDDLTPVVAKSKLLPDDIGAFDAGGTLEMVAKGHLSDFTLAVGALHAN
jgi:hypothetical protein